MHAMRDGAFITTAIAISFLAAPVGAQERYTQDDHLRRQMQAVGLIKETANSICYTVKQGGQKTQSNLSGEVESQLSMAASSLKELNIRGGGRVETVDYQGLAQEALGPAMRESQECKQSVFNRLIVIMVPSVQDTGLPVTKSVHLNPRRPENKPSISCSNITEPLEKLLCADDDLATWDGRMGQLYWQQMRQLSSAGQQKLRQQQLSWLNRRNAACRYNPLQGYTLDELAPAKPCILQMTKQRTAELE